MRISEYTKVQGLIPRMVPDLFIGHAVSNLRSLSPSFRSMITEHDGISPLARDSSNARLMYRLNLPPQVTDELDRLAVCGVFTSSHRRDTITGSCRHERIPRLYERANVEYFTYTVCTAERGARHDNLP